MATVTNAPTTIDEAIARMRQIGADLDPSDGVGCFNRMYLKVTELVKRNVTEGTFQDSAFLERMDVIFAGMYLRNVDAALAGRPVDAAWAPLFRARGNHVIWPVQFAFAGMNAHINHDLAVAVVETCTERRTTPGTPPVHQDYEKVNELLGSVEAEVRAEFEIQIVKVATQDAETLKHAVSKFSMAAAREAAWNTAQVLWREKNGINPMAYSGHEIALGEAVGVVGESILLPVVPPPPA
ncbi:DUF5995 family protein [Streptomyces sp. NPDC088124]|uniref:DUF5995 family protein n=1 Tax=Streptomyces sp. NPDC088124 TaxID=3154654 RepID=UPI003435DDF4